VQGSPARGRSSASRPCSASLRTQAGISGLVKLHHGTTAAEASSSSRPFASTAALWLEVMTWSRLEAHGRAMAAAG